MNEWERLTRYQCMNGFPRAKKKVCIENAVSFSHTNDGEKSERMSERESVRVSV